MPTDAKCGLLVGVGLVVAAAILFFQKDPEATTLAIPAPDAGSVTQLSRTGTAEKPLTPPPLIPVNEPQGRFVSLKK
jgi:hypothetical protein